MCLLEIEADPNPIAAALGEEAAVIVDGLTEHLAKEGSTASSILQAMMKQPEFVHSFLRLDYWGRLFEQAASPNFSVSSEAFSLIEYMVLKTNEHF